MADREQVEVLRKGGSAWNAWRNANPVISPDLSGVELVGADLRGANLRGANLFEAKLARANLAGWADLSEAKLGRANFHGANLFKANLAMADLGGADLRGANLHRANFFEAKLAEANFFEANLFEANLHRANLARAHLVGADLRGKKLIGADLRGADLRGANLAKANLDAANFFEANLVDADLGGANLRAANLFRAHLVGADLCGACLVMANCTRADLRKAKLGGADLRGANLVETDLTGANLTGCHIYGVSAWGLKLTLDTEQQDLVITQIGEPKVTVDNLEVAQFIYLLLHNDKIREVIDTITSKAVLILGRFIPERKEVLDALRDELRRRNRTPIVFDFSGPRSKNTTDTVKLLAQMARYVIVDLSEAGKHVALVDIVFDDRTFAIEYLTSTNLNYDDERCRTKPRTGGSPASGARKAPGKAPGKAPERTCNEVIHPHYNAWVRELEESVARTTAFALPQTPPPAQTQSDVFVADELIKLKKLHEEGLLTEEELQQQKEKLLAQ